ncbi:MAG: aspartate aminotransferase family protein [Acidimicrobiales bacterium]
MSHQDLYQRHKAVMPNWVSLFYEEPIALDRGSGVRVTDAEGKEYLDFFGGILTTMTGYGIPEVTDALHRQADKIWHSSTLYLIEPMIALAEKIAGLSGIPDAKVFFTTSGTEANDAALLLATGFRRTNQILAVRNSYHGRSFSTLSVTGNRFYSPTSFSPFQVSYLLGGSRLRGPLAGLSDDEYIRRGSEDLIDLLQTQTTGRPACLIAEPIQGVGGFATPPDGYFGALKKILDESGTLYISDEVQTGWGRTGSHFWGYEAHGVVPDLLTFAKGIGNGMALAGVVGRAEIMDSLGASSISTFGGSPIVSAVGLANLEYLLANDLQHNALRQGGHIREVLERTGKASEIVADVRGKGLMIGVELCEPGTVVPSPAAANAVLEETKRRGLLVGKGGLAGNVLRIAPPLSIGDADADEGAQILAESIATVSGR